MENDQRVRLADHLISDDQPEYQRMYDERCDVSIPFNLIRRGALPTLCNQWNLDLTPEMRAIYGQV